MRLHLRVFKLSRTNLLILFFVSAAYVQVTQSPPWEIFAGREASEDNQHLQMGQNPHLHNPDYYVVSRSNTLLSANERTLYLVTPTYNRPTQMADLTRAAQVVMSVPNCHWIVVEDAVDRTPWIEHLLSRLGISHTVMACKRPLSKMKQIANGYTQRNCALEWLDSRGTQGGILYFLDDDNTFDLRNFEEVRKAKKVALVPVGNLVDSGISSPLYNGGKLVDWIDPWPAGRKWPTDMACFAINITFWRERGAPKMVNVRGKLETKLLEHMKVRTSNFESQADKCTKVYGWHTQTKWDIRPLASSWERHICRYPQSNLVQLQKFVAPLLT